MGKSVLRKKETEQEWKRPKRRAAQKDGKRGQKKIVREGVRKRMEKGLENKGDCEEEGTRGAKEEERKAEELEGGRKRRWRKQE